MEKKKFIFQPNAFFIWAYLRTLLSVIQRQKLVREIFLFDESYKTVVAAKILEMNKNMELLRLGPVSTFDVCSKN